MMKTTPFLLGGLAALVVSACSDTSVNPDESLLGPDTSIPDSQVQARLRTLESSEAFYSALRLALLNQAGAYGTDDVQIAEESIVVASPSSDIALPTEASGDFSLSAVGADNEVTSTNVQEVGVDEQDRVKVNAAGTQLFVLHSEYQYHYGTPSIEILDGEVDTVASIEPVDTSAIASDSQVIGPEQVITTLRILALDADTPDATSINDMGIDLQGQRADGFYLYETDTEKSAVITASGGGYWGYWDTSVAFSGLKSTIAKVDVSDAANAAMFDTFTIDGQIISSRRIGDSLFFASRYYPTIPGFEPWQQGSQQWHETVESTDLATLMPQFSSSGSEQSAPLVNAAECFVAPVSANQPYYSPDIITLGVIDLSSMQLRDSECFLGSTETLYATTESVFLATTQYDYSSGPETTTGDVVDTSVAVFESEEQWTDPRTTTDIHQFDIQSDQLSYAGSGSVRGHLGWNTLQKPFRMSESGGYLRVATMNDQQGPDHSPILMNVLQADGQGNLTTVSTLPNETQPGHIGKPGERLYASRFIGNRAYLVTFRQTDPLYLIDLSDPANPQVTGELEIEGYSDYLQPIGENHLLGIGKNAVAADDGWGDGRGAWVQGIKLSLFDISDPSAPTEVQSVLVGERGTNSVALTNHRAITIQAATDQHPVRVSFGIDLHGEASPLSSPSPQHAWDYAQWNYTGLHGFDVTSGVNANISSRGALIVSRANDPQGSYGFYGDDRSVMVNNAIFYINGRDVYPAMWDSLDAGTQAR